LKDFIKFYRNENEDAMNFDLMNRIHDKDLIQYLVNSCKSLEVLKYVKFLGYEYVDDDKVFGLVSDIKINGLKVYAEEGLPNLKVKIYSETENVAFKNISIIDLTVNGKKIGNLDGFEAYIDEKTKGLSIK
jgi:hypothetical protein